MAKKGQNKNSETTQEPKKKLSERHQRFVLEYLQDFNATQAYSRCYPDSSYEAARRSGSDLLSKPDIRAAIEERAEEARAKLKVTQEEVIADLKELRDMCMGRRKVKRTVFKKNEDGTSEAVEVETTMQEPHAAKGALELIGKHLAMFTDKVKTEDEVLVIVKDFTGKKS